MTTRDRPIVLAGWAAFVLLGWTAPLVPALIRSIERDFAQTDAGLGAFFLAQAVAFTVGSFVSGFLTEQVGRRSTLVGGLVIQAIGLACQGGAGEWGIFVAGGVLRGLGSGAVEASVQGLLLDTPTSAPSRAMNVLHVFWSLGALAAPVGAAALVGIGVPWPTLLVASAAASVGVAAVYAIIGMPSGRRRRLPGTARVPLGLPLLAAGGAIAAYVAAEAGVSSWLVRFLSAAPIAVASSALSLFWGGLTVGRLVVARYGDRLDPVRLAVRAAIIAGASIVAAVAVPWVPMSIALFALAGFACGPIYATIILIGGRVSPGRAAAVTGLLSGAAVAGAVAYPPLMGAISIAAGIGIAMLGTALLAVACAVLLVFAGRSARGASALA